MAGFAQQPLIAGFSSFRGQWEPLRGPNRDQSSESVEADQGKNPSHPLHACCRWPAASATRTLPAGHAGSATPVGFTASHSGRAPTTARDGQGHGRQHGQRTARTLPRPSQVIRVDDLGVTARAVAGRRPVSRGAPGPARAASPPSGVFGEARRRTGADAPARAITATIYGNWERVRSPQQAQSRCLPRRES
jgi:hypothetical protein